VGLKKYGLPSNSAAVHGFRYNARVLARHIAVTQFHLPTQPRQVPRDRVVDLLLREATSAPELWNQQSYLARVVTFPRDGRVEDAGVEPLAHFVDSPGPDAAAVTVETDDQGDIHPALYVRRGGTVREHTMPSDPLHDFTTAEHRTQLASVLGTLV